MATKPKSPSTTKTTAAPEPVEAAAPVEENPVRRARQVEKDRADGVAETGGRVMARRPFKYGGKALSRQQIFELGGHPNDERLLRLGYVSKVTATQKTVTCGECGAEFVGGSFRDSHVNSVHRLIERPKPTMDARLPGESAADYAVREADFLQEAMRHDAAEEEARTDGLEREAPLNWDQTAASREDRI